MSKVQAGPIQADRLKSFIERIEKLEEERTALGGDLRDVYSEAKGVGYDVKTMRKIVGLRKQDAADRDEQDTLLDVYKHALGMLTNGPEPEPRELTEDELVALAGKIAGEVEQCLDLVGVDGQPPTIAAIETRLECSRGKASKIRGMVIEESSRRIALKRELELPPAPQSTLPVPEAWQEVAAVAGEHTERGELVKEASRDNRLFDKAQRDDLDTRVDGDTLEIPEPFRRNKELGSLTETVSNASERSGTNE